MSFDLHTFATSSLAISHAKLHSLVGTRFAPHFLCLLMSTPRIEAEHVREDAKDHENFDKSFY
jgi:hypothetical protein